MDLMRAFATATVQDKKIILKHPEGRSLTHDELWEIYCRFADDLLDYKIPHYRIVGIKFPSNLLIDSVLRTVSNYGTSVIDLSLKCEKLIPCLPSPYNPMFVSKQERVSEDYTGRIERILYTDNEIHALIHISDNIYLSDMFDGDVNDISTDTLRYANEMEYFVNEGDQLGYINARVPFLLKDITLCKVDTSIQSGFETVFFYMKGTGIKEYSEISLLFDRDKKVFPVRAKFDLCSFFTCRVPMDLNQTDYLELEYLEDINEVALTGILRDYGKEFGE